MGSDAALAERASGKPSKALRRIVDADAHIDMPHEVWADYLPEKFRELAPQIEEGEDCDYIVFEGKRRPIMMINNQAGRKGKDFKMVGKRSELRAVWMPAQRIADMDQDGIDSAVLFGGGSLGTSNPDLYIASFDAWNRWVWDFCGVDRKRLIPVAYLPMRDIDESIGILRRAAKLGFRSANIPAFPQSTDGISTSSRVQAIATGQGAALTGNPAGGRQYSDPDFDRLWQEFVDLDMTITIHLGARIPRFGEKDHFLADMLMSKLAMAEPAAILIYSGVFQRFPKLRFVTVESGVGWMAFAAEYMDRTWEKQRYWTDSPLTEPPSFYMDQNVYGSFINDRLGITCRDLPGGKNIMWSSDYPHSETTFPNSKDVIDRDFVGVPEQAVREICADRAAKIYSVG